MGHYNHLDTINAINTYGSIPAFIEGEGISSGIIYNCVKHNVPFVLNGSIRDDGPLPEVYEHTYVGQDTIRSHVRKATTVIGMATVLHTIATGNMTPTYRVLAAASQPKVSSQTYRTLCATSVRGWEFNARKSFDAACAMTLGKRFSGGIFVSKDCILGVKVLYCA